MVLRPLPTKLYKGKSKSSSSFPNICRFNAFPFSLWDIKSTLKNLVSHSHLCVSSSRTPNEFIVSIPFLLCVCGFLTVHLLMKESEFCEVGSDKAFYYILKLQTFPSQTSQAVSPNLQLLSSVTFFFSF